MFTRRFVGFCWRRAGRFVRGLPWIHGDYGSAAKCLGSATVVPTTRAVAPSVGDSASSDARSERRVDTRPARGRQSCAHTHVIGQHDPHLVRRTRPPASRTTRLLGTSETLRARDRDGSLHGHDSGLEHGFVCGGSAILRSTQRITTDRPGRVFGRSWSAGSGQGRSERVGPDRVGPKLAGSDEMTTGLRLRPDTRCATH